MTRLIDLDKVTLAGEYGVFLTQDNLVLTTQDDIVAQDSSSETKYELYKTITPVDSKSIKAGHVLYILKKKEQY